MRAEVDASGRTPGECETRCTFGDQWIDPGVRIEALWDRLTCFRPKEHRRRGEPRLVRITAL